jgi:hypothetical protein
MTILLRFFQAERDVLGELSPDSNLDARTGRMPGMIDNYLEKS